MDGLVSSFPAHTITFQHLGAGGTEMSHLLTPDPGQRRWRVLLCASCLARRFALNAPCPMDRDWHTGTTHSADPGRCQGILRGQAAGHSAGWGQRWMATPAR